METAKQENSATRGQAEYADESVRVAEGATGTIEVHTSTINEKTRGVEHDDAANLFEGDGGVFEYTQVEANRVRLKLDMILLPMVCPLHIVNPWNGCILILTRGT